MLAVGPARASSRATMLRPASRPRLASARRPVSAPVPGGLPRGASSAFGQSRRATAIHSHMIGVSSEKSSPWRAVEARYHALIAARHQASVRSPSP
jgi:hypothetical protein